MAVTAQNGILSWGPQASKGTIAAKFYKHRAADIDLSAISDDRLGPPEVGGVATPTFPYRAGVMAAGGFTINPRLEDTFGWLLYAVSGAWTAASNTDVMGTTATGFQTHTFKFASDGTVPFISCRKFIPGSATLGETYIDCKLTSMTLALPNDGPINARIDVSGITPGFDDNPSWTYDNTLMEDYQSIPVGCVTGGYIKCTELSADPLAITAAQVTFANNPLDIRQEKQYGSPYLQDVTITGRQLSVDMVVKWDNPELYLKILTGSTTGTVWNVAPWMGDLDIYTLSASPAVSTYPWQLRIQAPEVMYQVVGGVRLAGNGAVMMRVQGTAIAPPSGDYYTIKLGNTESTTNYTWPT